MNPADCPCDWTCDNCRPKYEYTTFQLNKFDPLLRDSFFIGDMVWVRTARDWYADGPSGYLVGEVLDIHNEHLLVQGVGKVHRSSCGKVPYAGTVKTCTNTD